MQPQHWENAAPSKEVPWEQFVLRGGEQGSGQAALGLWGCSLRGPWGFLCSGTILVNAVLEPCSFCK